MKTLQEDSRTGCLLSLAFLLVNGVGIGAAEFRIDSVQRQAAQMEFGFLSEDTCYYILWRGDRLEDIRLATDLVRGVIGQGLLADGSPTNTARFYRIEKVSLRSSRDTDGDGISDAWELQRRQPGAALNSTDANLDQDGNGKPDGMDYLRERIESLRAGAPGGFPVIAAQGDHTLAIQQDNGLWAWGRNLEGQLGIGTFGTNLPPASHFGIGQPTRVATNMLWRTVAAGGGHTVAIRTDGTLWAWGANQLGQLGDGQFMTNGYPTGTGRSDPIQVGTNSNWKAVAAGSQHTVALREDGTLWAWGYNSGGQLGLGSFEPAWPWSRNLPEQVGTNTNWVAVTANGAQTMALRSDGSLWVWGGNGYGALGDGSYENRPMPVQIGSNAVWRAVAAGGFHTVALRDDGTLWAWGRNDSGQLGVGTFYFSTDRPVQVGTNRNWVAVAASGELGDSSKGYTLAIQEDGSLWTWGWNQDGRLADGTFSNKPYPVRLGTNSNWVAVSAGSGQSVALRDDGTLWSWGDNLSGQLGDGTHLASQGRMQTLPVPVETNAVWKHVAPGYGHVLAIRGDDTLWSWGLNTNGQLGDATLESRSIPQRVGTNATWKAVAGGWYHTVAVRMDGTLWTCGDNGNGQLGIGSLDSYRGRLTQVGTNSNWATVVAGRSHTLALREDRTLWAWGWNIFGQLGLGIVFPSTNSPVRVGTNTNWTALTAGADHTVVLRDDGTLWAFGASPNGQTIQVGTNSDWVTVAAGAAHSLALRRDGTLWWWGRKAPGFCCYVAVPEQVGTSSGWQAVGAGFFHSLGLLTDGTLWSWGDNFKGQLGNGTTIGAGEPVPVATDSRWRMATAAEYFSAAIRDDGSLWAWGINNVGQLAQDARVPVLGGAVWGPVRP